jgi:hypothetical protein
MRLIGHPLSCTRHTLHQMGKACDGVAFGLSCIHVLKSATPQFISVVHRLFISIYIELVTSIARDDVSGCERKYLMVSSWAAYLD